MARPARPVSELRKQYSLLINRGRELVARPLERGADFTRLVDDAQQWERDCLLLVQSTWRDETPDFDRLPPPPVTGDMARDQSAFNRDLSAMIQQLDQISDRLALQKSGCLGL